mmetsp:Transcript_8303/g.8461  ORF Transcript_8303/g.8461 Transcript_8303/m.8461 type:complete len:442 (+) Transcript_8303:73-1398(+)
MLQEASWVEEQECPRSELDDYLGTQLLVTNCDDAFDSISVGNVSDISDGELSLNSSVNNTKLFSAWQDKYSSSLELTTEQKHVLSRFVESAYQLANEVGIDNGLDWKIENAASRENISFTDMPKNLINAIWIEFLDITRRFVDPESFKYKSINDFVEAYPDQQFHTYSEEELSNLFHTANWMNIFFSMETARKNKGLIMDVIPRLVEGPGARYITGSGQTLATSDRVLIYETEGGVKPSARGKRRKMVQETKIPIERVPQKRGPKRKKLKLNADVDSTRTESLLVTRPIADPPQIIYTLVPSPLPSIIPTDINRNTNTHIEENDQFLDCLNWMALLDTPQDSSDDSSPYSLPTRTNERIEDMPPSTTSYSQLYQTSTEPLNGDQCISTKLTKTAKCPAMPRLWRSLTDRGAMLQLLEEVGGDENPVGIDGVIFHPRMLHTL